MRVSKPIFAFVCVLISALLMRAAISATMPIMMSGMGSAAVVEASAQEMSDECPGHSAAAKVDGSGDSMSCAWCGECCVSAPVFAFNPDSSIAQISPNARFPARAIARIPYLTPGRYRPPAA